MHIRLKLLKIENKTIYDEIEYNQSQGLKPGDSIKLMLQELVYLRRILSILEDENSQSVPEADELDFNEAGNILQDVFSD